ncbi:threonine/serine dehydratase [Streptomyces sp. NPDC021622]|uniref:threonine ammonia-lyase n=1 Tax=Streptomyces sp. NPDC021622 TaxID=3155013 RepID=UPI0033ED6E48
MLISDVERAAGRIAGRAIRTPVLRLPALDAAVGAKVALKAEMYQHSNAFKFRGALNKMLMLGPASLRRGVVAGSSGNHGRAVAQLAESFGVPALLVLPRDVSELKLAAVRRHGATVVTYDPESDDRDTITAALAAERGLPVLPSSDDPDVAAGHGTVALELFADAGHLDQLIVPVGGGGLAAGCATVAKALNPTIKVIGVEPEDADDTARSLRAGRRVIVPPPRTLADGLRHRTPGRFTFDVNRALLDGIETVSDHEIAGAMGFLWKHDRLVVEPSGACAAAAVLRLRAGAPEERIGVVLSGGNIAVDRFHEIIGSVRSGERMMSVLES